MHLSLLFLALGAILLCPGSLRAQPTIGTDMVVYPPNTPIEVYFSGAPGSSRDWVCIVPSGSRDDDAGNYQYLPEGKEEGTLRFDGKPAGEYEARAYYNYQKNGYVVSARFPFIVSDGSSTNAAKGNADTSLNTMTRLAGQGTRMAGEAMEQMGKENEGTAVGTLLTFGGKVSTSVGSAVEGSAKNNEGVGETVNSALNVGARAVTNADTSGTNDRQTIIAAQKILIQQGYYDGAPDGIIGEKTTSAIAKFQKDNGLSATGRLNVATFKALGI